MSIPITTVQSLIGSHPLGLMTAHQWYSDYPTDADLTFSGTGFFSGGDLPFGVIYEIHNTPAGSAFTWRDSISFTQPFAHIVNNAAILGGYGSSLPVEEFFLARPRGLLRFDEPTTTSIIVECLAGVFLELWGLYIDIPLVGITQPTWHQTVTGESFFTPTLDGTTFVGLSGHGSLAVDVGAVGVRITVSTLPPELGEDVGTPTRIFDLGFVAFGDISGYRRTDRIEATEFYSFVEPGVAADTLGYTLHDGVVANFTMLLPNRPVGT